MDDIAPYILELLENEFQELYEKNDKIKKILKLINEGNATYEEANDYAIELGEMLAKCYSDCITSDILPDGKMYFNIAKRTIEPTMKNNFNLISSVSTQVQKSLNDKAGIGLQAVSPEINQYKIDSIINKVSSDQFEEVAFILQEPIVHFSQSVVDDTIKANVELHSRSGLHPKITRKVRGGCCKWCMNLAGTYSYPDDVPDDVYRRHDHCRCVVIFDPGEGKLVQNVHTKSWENREEIQDRINFSEGTKLYFCKSIKTDWLKQFDRNQIRVIEKNYFDYDGKRYVVDGKNVVLDHSQRELQVAELIANQFGTQVEIVPRINLPKGISTPDYFIRGYSFDSKRIIGSGKNTIDSSIKEKKRQSNNFIFDITAKTNLSVDEIYRQIDKLYANKYRTWVNMIMLIKENKIIDLLNRKKG